MRVLLRRHIFALRQEKFQFARSTWGQPRLGGRTAISFAVAERVASPSALRGHLGVVTGPLPNFTYEKARPVVFDRATVSVMRHRRLSGLRNTQDSC